MESQGITTDWKGLPVVSASLTDFLLHTEDLLDENLGGFIQFLGNREISGLLNGKPILSEADTLVLSSPILSGLASLISDTPLSPIPMDTYTRVALELVKDSGFYACVLSQGAKGMTTAIQREGFKKLHLNREAHSDEEVLDTLKNKKVGMVISNWDVQTAQKLYRQMEKEYRKVIWIQLPAASGASREQQVVPRKLREAVLACKLLTMRSFMHQESK